MDLPKLLQGRLTLSRVTLFLGSEDNTQSRREATQRAIELLQHFQVLPTKNEEHARQCPTCGAHLGNFIDRENNLGWRYKCLRGHTFTPTANTFLERTRLGELGGGKIVKMLMYWVLGISQTRIIDQEEIAADTAVAWCSYFRDVARKIAWHDFTQIGGLDDIVEVSATRLFQRKYNKEGMPMFQHVWLFGGISRWTKKKFGLIVDRQDENTLLHIMQMYIDADSCIFSDQCRAYLRLGEAFQGHETVKHAIEFVRPPGPSMQPYKVHTNTIKRQWRDLKKTLRSINDVELADAYIGEWMYRSNILNAIEDTSDKIRKFLTDIGRAYPGIGKIPMIADLENCNCHECQPV